MRSGIFRPGQFAAVMLVLLMVMVSAAAAQEAVAAGDLSIPEMAVCRQVKNRLPLGIGSVFAAEVGTLFCFTRVVGASDDIVIHHDWYLNGVLKNRAALPVQSSDWRIWSVKSIGPDDVGDWTVKVTTADGRHIQSIIFFVVE